MLLFNDNVSMLRSSRRSGRAVRTPDSEAGTAPLSPPQLLRRVALAIDPGRGAHAHEGPALLSALLHGIAQFNSQRGGWQIELISGGASGASSAALSQGIIVRDAPAPIIELAKARGISLVSIRTTSAAAPTNLPAVAFDDAGIAAAAFQHLRERAISHFACIESARGDARCEYFRRIAQRESCVCHTFHARDANESPIDESVLIKWLGSLPKPIGILAADDALGLRLLNACRSADIAVPDEVAVLGIGNDQAMCELSIPPLSSVDINAEGAGSEAAAMLERMLNGGRPAERPILISPRAVVSRRSTDVLACEDADVSRALRYIRQSACRGLQVIDVLGFMGMSRATLQQRMKQTAGRTIHQEIKRVRLARVKELLVNSDLTIKQVARESGFASVQYLTRVFRAVTGETPAKYRERREK